MSSCATSAAHDNRNAAPTIASPNRTASIAWPVEGSAMRTHSAGRAAAAASTKARRLREVSAAGAVVVIGSGDPSSPRLDSIRAAWTGRC